MSLSPLSPVNKTPSSEQAAPDRRLSVAEVWVLVILLICGVIFAVIFLQNRLTQNRTDQLHSAAQAVSVWVSAAHQARLRGAVLEPERCSITQHQPLSFVFLIWFHQASPLQG